MSEIDFLLDLFELSEGAAAAKAGLPKPSPEKNASDEKRESSNKISAERRQRTLVSEMSVLHPQMVQTAKLAEIGLNFAEMIHELRQPMAGIFGFAQLLAEKPGHASAAEWAEEIVQQTLRMQQMIERLRRFCRSESVIKFEWLDPRAALDEAIRLLPKRHPKIRIVPDIPTELPLVHADHNALVQIFWNLLVNARDAMSLGELTEELTDMTPMSGRDIRIETVCGDPSGLTFRVLDQGHGIPDDLKATLFSPFVTSKGERGTGLGLYICRNLATSIGATLGIATARAPFSTAFELRFKSTKER